MQTKRRKMRNFHPLTNNQFQWFLGLTIGFMVWLNLSWLVHYAPIFRTAYIPYLVSGFYTWIIWIIVLIFQLLWILDKPLKSLQWSIPIISVLLLGRYISLEFLHDIHLTLEYFTRGAVTTRFWLGFTFHFLFLYLFLHKQCGYGLKNFGIEKKYIREGLIFLVIAWVVFNALDLAVVYMSEGMFVVHPKWEGINGLMVVRNFLESLFGTVLFEEIFCRVILLQQFYFIISKRKENRFFPHAAKAIAFSSIVFALYHMPLWLSRNHNLYEFIFSTQPLSLPTLFLIGILYCLVIIRTNNIFIPVVLHTFHNTSLALFENHHWQYSEYLVIIIILVFWKKDPGNFLNNYRYLPVDKLSEEDLKS